MSSDDMQYLVDCQKTLDKFARDRERSKKYVTQGNIDEGLVPAISMLVDHVVEPLRAELKRIKDRLEAVEQRGVEYVGVHQRAVGYRVGSICTASGSMWCAIEETQPGECPGESAKWQLAVKGTR